MAFHSIYADVRRILLKVLSLFLYIFSKLLIRSDAIAQGFEANTQSNSISGRIANDYSLYCMEFRETNQFLSNKWRLNFVTDFVFGRRYNQIYVWLSPSVAKRRQLSENNDRSDAMPSEAQPMPSLATNSALIFISFFIQLFWISNSNSPKKWWKLDLS